MISSFKEMPVGLKFLTAHALVCVVFFLSAVAPGIPVTVNGQQMDSQEIWSGGMGIFMVVVGIAMPVSALLMLKKTKHARIAYLCALSFGLVAPYIYMNQAELVFVGLGTVAVIACYLYFRSTAREYFASNSSSGPTPRAGAS